MKHVEVAGHNQSVIIHTATGGHLRKLESLFADVKPPASRDELSPEENEPLRREIVED